MIELRTLGSLDVLGPDGREVRLVLAQPKRLALLAYLAIAAPGRFVRRDTLLALFWAESTDERARGALRQSVRYLRRSLGEGVLVHRAEDELGIAEGALACDAAECRQALSSGDARRAVELYRGDLLEGFFIANAPEFERWLEGERATLRKLIASAAWTLADAAQAAGDGVSACEWARRATDLAPLDENAARRRMILLEAAGDGIGAIRFCEEFEKRLAAELEMPAGAETRTLAHDIRERASAEAAPTAGRPAPRSFMAPVTPDATLSVSRPTRVRGVAGYAAAVATTVVLILAGFGYLTPKTASQQLNPRRVVVAPFENRSGNPSLDPVASMAADWIIQGVVGMGALEVVPLRAVLVSIRSIADSATATADDDPYFRSLARETGAGTVVSGSFYGQGDSLYFQARIIDMGTGRVRGAVGPISSPAAAPLLGVDRLRQEVLVTLAPLSDERGTHIHLAGKPPTYGAYRAYVTGFESFVQRDWLAALRHFERAASVDTTYLMPALAAGIMHMNLGNPAAADSIAQRVDRSRDALNPMELAHLDLLQSFLRGDDAKAYEAMVRAARIAPGSIVEYQVGEQARRLNRPRETVRVLRAMGPERGELRGFFLYWRELATAHHMLGEHREELKVARRARDLYPERAHGILLEVRALAALGRVTDVNARIDDRAASPAVDDPDAGLLMLFAAQELRAHGHFQASLLLLNRIIDRFHSLPVEGQQARASRAQLAQALYESGEWSDAGAIFLGLAAEYPAVVAYQGRLGVIAARQGNQAEAERIAAALRSLREPYLWGRHTLWQARIAAALGEREQAVELLRAAFSQGIEHHPTLHSDVDFESLHDYPPYRGLMRPRGR